MLQTVSRLLPELPLTLVTAVATHFVMSFAQTLMHYKLGHRPGDDHKHDRDGALARRDGLTHTAVAANFALLLVASRTAHLQRSTVARINDQIDSICSISSTSRHGGIWLLPLSTELTKRS